MDSISSLDAIPSIWYRILPPLKSRTVGNDLIWYRLANFRLPSRLILMSLSVISASFTTRWSTGSINRHRPHHGTKKFTRTGIGDCNTSWLNHCSRSVNVMFAKCRFFVACSIGPSLLFTAYRSQASGAVPKFWVDQGIRLK
jgi:hypothetical protein